MMEEMKMENAKKTAETQFDFEKLVVYRRAMQALELLSDYIARPPRKAANLADHLDRALDSVLLNISEGCGKPAGSADRAKFYRTSLGSAKEAGSAINILSAKKLMSSEMAYEARSLLLEVVAMLHSMAGI